jgi:hypothetical protein
VDLNRDNLVVICGPRISPLIAEVLKTDSVLQFERDDSSWFLTDQSTGHTYHSPSDDPAQPPGDVAYLSRQARPDGNGSFILLTGIHAVGSSGVIHYLTRELADLYEQVGIRRFSTLIASSPRGSTRPPAASPAVAASLRSTSTRTPDAMQVAFATQPAPGGAVNEDFITATDRVVILLDGASVPQGMEIGCRHGTAWYVGRLGRRLLDQLTDQPGQLLTDALAAAIQAVASLHADTCQLDHPGGPSAAVALLREADQTVDYLVLADTTVLLDETSDLHVISDDRLAQVAVTEHSAMHREATGTVTHQQRYADLVTELRRHRNQDAGYWVAGSTPDAAYHALTGTVPRSELRRVGLLSDGATRLVDRFGTMAWPHLLDVLDREGPYALIVQTREAENGDPEGRRWPRSKRHDDASAVLCRFRCDS